jgi:putative transposase
MSLEFTGNLKAHGIQISMGGTGSWRDNVFVERLWRSVKYEEMYLHACDSLSEAQNGLGQYLTFYNQRIPHTALDNKTTDEVYFDNRPALPQIAQVHTCRATLMKTELLSKQSRPPLPISSWTHGSHSPSGADLGFHPAQDNAKRSLETQLPVEPIGLVKITREQLLHRGVQLLVEILIQV